jgi:1-deoxy-D-xylulose-5-phosphate reductoisomerase
MNLSPIRTVADAYSPRVQRKQVAIFGSTGSIGTSALEVMASLHQADPEWRVTALSAHGRLEELAAQVERFRPGFVVVTGSEPDRAMRSRLESGGARLLLGPEGMAEVAADRDSGGTVLASVVGAAGLPAVLAAVKAGKRLALANKESLVVAGSLVMPLARQSQAEILPVDSEHSAIYQAMLAGRRSEVLRVILTASGGPFRTTPFEQMHRATAAEALNHPTWRMGGKITIDSATLFNKAFELIEARWLFDLRPDELSIVVHPQSIVHSFVEFVDGNVLAQLSPPDMKTPIQYTLTHPDRLACPGRKMDWSASFGLTFEPPDRKRFPSVDLADAVIRQDGPTGGTAGATLNAANEVAVGEFLEGRIPFGRITEVVRGVMDRFCWQVSPSLDVLLEADADARVRAMELIRSGGQ